jgi:hypothetical protein
MENGSNGEGGQDRIYVMADVEDTVRSTAAPKSPKAFSYATTV